MFLSKEFIMKCIFVIVLSVFVFSQVAFGGPPQVVPSGTTNIQRNLSGGYNYSSSGRNNGRSVSNAFGGQTFYGSRGQVTGRTQSTVSGGYRYSSVGKR
jgi:hypothetical protein